MRRDNTNTPNPHRTVLQMTCDETTHCKGPETSHHTALQTAWGTHTAPRCACDKRRRQTTPYHMCDAMSRSGVMSSRLISCMTRCGAAWCSNMCSGSNILSRLFSSNLMPPDRISSYRSARIAQDDETHQTTLCASHHTSYTADIVWCLVSCGVVFVSSHLVSFVVRCGMLCCVVLSQCP